MERRDFLAWLSAGASGHLAGCSHQVSFDESTGAQNIQYSETSVRSGKNESTNTVGGIELPVRKKELERGAAKDGISAIKNPVFDKDWQGIEITVPKGIGYGPINEVTIQPRLKNNDQIIGINRGGQARAYPLKVLNWHEVVNDTLDEPLLITYCPLCGSGVTAIRRVSDTTTIFGVSGWLFRSNLVLYDEKTESLWSQIVTTAIRGPETGTTLSVEPSAFTTWGEWRNIHPDTEVLQPPPISKTIVEGNVRDYRIDPYDDYEHSRQRGTGTQDTTRSDLHPKTQVIGVATANAAKAFPRSRIRKVGLVNDRVGDLPVVVTVSKDGQRFVAYVRRINGQVMQFQRVGSNHIRADGSNWTIGTGQAVDGPHENTVLDQANEQAPMYWFAWKEFHPNTLVFTDNGN